MNDEIGTFLLLSVKIILVEGINLIRKRIVFGKFECASHFQQLNKKKTSQYSIWTREKEQSECIKSLFLSIRYSESLFSRKLGRINGSENLICSYQDKLLVALSLSCWEEMTGDLLVKLYTPSPNHISVEFFRLLLVVRQCWLLLWFIEMSALYYSVFFFLGCICAVSGDW